MLFASGLKVAESVTAPGAGRKQTTGIAVLVLLAAIGALSGCGARPFNVKPRPSLGKPDYGASGTLDGMGIQAQAITDEDYLYEIFDANLIQAGIYPVRIRITNNGSDTVELKRAKFGIKSGAGKPFKVVEGRRAYKRLISYYELTLYSKDGYKRSLGDFESHVLDTASPLASGESRDGILFFLVPADVAVESGLTLEAARMGKQARSDATLELKLK